MMYVYSGYDSLNDAEFDALMQEMADNNADDYFTNELAKEFASPEVQAQLHARYQLIVVWDDISSKTESCDDIIAALNAATIYMMDPSCISTTIYDWKEQKDILHWNR